MIKMPFSDLSQRFIYFFSVINFTHNLIFMYAKYGPNLANSYFWLYNPELITFISYPISKHNHLTSLETIWKVIL